MNCFAHTFPFLDRDPYFVIGCALPDWLGAADRRCRIRRKNAEITRLNATGCSSNLAGGIVQHLDDDKAFHSTPVFNQLSISFAIELRQRLSEPGFRPGFLGHILIELMLDAYLYEHNPGQLDRLYRIVGGIDAESVQRNVNSMANRATDQLVSYIRLFIREQYLYDYTNNAKLLYRVNRVLHRVKLKPLDGELNDWLPDARIRVYERAIALLASR